MTSYERIALSFALDAVLAAAKAASIDTCSIAKIVNSNRIGQTPLKTCVDAVIGSAKAKGMHYNRSLRAWCV